MCVFVMFGPTGCGSRVDRMALVRVSDKQDSAAFGMGSRGSTTLLLVLGLRQMLGLGVRWAGGEVGWAGAWALVYW